MQIFWGGKGGVVDQENTSRVVGKEGNPWSKYEWADSHCGQLRFVSTGKLWDTVYDPHRVVATWKYGELGCLFSHWWWGSGGRGRHRLCSMRIQLAWEWRRPRGASQCHPPPPCLSSLSCYPFLVSPNGLLIQGQWQLLQKAFLIFSQNQWLWYPQSQYTCCSIFLFQPLGFALPSAW